MKKYICLALLLLASPVMADTIVDEGTIQKTGYVHKESGVAYDPGGGYVLTDPTIVDGGTNWNVTTAPISWTLDKSTRSMIFTRGDKSVGIRPVGIYYVDRANWEWTQVSAALTPSVTAGASSILLEDLFTNVDMEVFSEKDGPVVDYLFKSKSGYPATPYAADDTWVCVVHELDLTDPPTILADGIAPVWAGTEAAGLKFSSTKDWDILPSDATAASGNVTRVKNFLVEKGAKYYFIEAIRYNWFLGETFPVRIHYTSKSGSSSGSETWTDGTTYFVSGSYVMGSSHNLEIEGGAFVKFADQTAVGGLSVLVSTLTISGTLDDPAYLTSCNDTSVGEDVTGEANCSGGAAAQADWTPILAKGGTYIQGAWIGYGGTNNLQWDMLNGDYIKDSVFYETGSAAVYLTPPASSTVTANANNNYFHLSNTNGRAFQFPSGYSATQTVTINIHNNFIYLNGASGQYGLLSQNADADWVLNFTSNTIVCSAASTHYGYRALSDPASWDTRDNIVTGCGTGYDQSGSGTHTYNMAYNNTTDFGAGWGASTGEITTDPDHQTHDDSSLGVPTWADDYHLGASSNATDAGSDTAANVSLDDRHSSVTAALDTGTVDLGFHYPAPASVPLTPLGGVNPSGVIFRGVIF